MDEDAAPLAPLPLPFAADAALDAFLDAMRQRGFELYGEQEEAILELYAGHHVILQTPTGSGKSLVAGAHLFRALCMGETAVYTCPIKALVNEKFLALCRDHGPDNVGLMTGDASVNPHAPVLCCTAEILANIALCGGQRARIAAVVMDEFHYYGDSDRGPAWQIPLLLMPQTQFLLMSATLGHTVFFEEELQLRSGRTAVTVSSDRRPVPLEFSYSDIPLTERLEGLVNQNRAPVYLVYFTQRAATDAAMGFLSLGLTLREERERLGAILAKESFRSPFGKDLQRCLRHGIGVHHAGLLPRYRLLVESLAQQGLLKIICGTDTLGVGINVPIRSVLFTQLWKFDGHKSAILTVRDFRQIAGRAGRRGFDSVGYVIAQAPEHVIENKRAEERAAATGKKKKTTRRSAPAGVPGWDENTFLRLQTAPHEPLIASFNVSHGMLLQVLSRDEDGCKVMRDLLRNAHITEHRKRELRHKSWQLFRALLQRNIIQLIEPLPCGRKLRVNVELQEDFSLHQTLSLYMVDTLTALDPQDAEYPFQVLTLCESILENPDAILRKQIDKLKADRIRALKAEGIPYEERMEKLMDIEHPKPMREFIYNSFNEFKAAHPWVEDDNIRPKSIAREIYEDYLSFAEYVLRYGLQRSEGVLLRHLSQVLKVLLQTVPDSAKNDAVYEMEDFLRELITLTDSSLIDEWERLRDPTYQAASTQALAQRERPVDCTRDPAVFQRKVRAAVFEFLRDEVLHAALDQRPQEFAGFFAERERFLLDPEARNQKHTHFQQDPDNQQLVVYQVLCDPAGLNDWQAQFVVDLPASRLQNLPVIRFVDLNRLL